MPELRYVQANGISLAYFEWRGELRGQQPTLLMVHATGFHGRVWDQVITHFPDRHVIALEQRGHGRSETTEITGWEVFGRDLAAFVAQLDLSGLIGIGHSMGAVALVQAAAFEPARFARLVLIDPVIFDPLRYHQALPAQGTVHPARKRLNQFESAQSMMNRFADRAPYSVFTKQALRDYCEHALTPCASGTGFQLACAPLTESTIYLTAIRNPGVFASVLAIKAPVLLVRARLPDGALKGGDFSSSPTWPGLVSKFSNAREVYLADRTHLVPMQDPALVAQLIQTEIKESHDGPRD